MTKTLLSVSISELCQIEEIESELVVDIVEYGIARPIAGSGAIDWVFEATSVHWIKKAVRLHRDLEIDWVAVAMVIDLMKQKEALQKENKRYQRQLRRFVEP
jgi:chaperone modulatory protein CbpM